MDRLAQFATFFLVVLAVGPVLREWTDWPNWIVALVTVSAALLAVVLTRSWWANYAGRHHWKIYSDE